MAQLTIQQAFDLARQQHEAGRLGPAEQLYHQILTQQPRHAGAMHLLGVIACQVGRHESAVDLIRQAIVLSPEDADFHNSFGVALSAAGRLDEAIAAYRQAIALKRDMSGPHSNLGNALREAGQLDEAISACRHAIALSPDNVQAHSNLGLALLEKGRADEAIAACQQAIVLQPNFANAHGNLGNALHRTGRLDEAIAAYQRAIGLQPGFVEAHSNLGNVLNQQGRLDEAVAAYRQAIRLEPGYAHAHRNLGTALWNQGHLQEAIAAYRQAITLMPHYAQAHYNIGLALLASGDFAQGWEEHEWRWKCNDFPSPPRNFVQGLWDGSLLQERTLLLHGEQGFGDTLQFIRYLPMVAQRGTRIIIECRPELCRLLQRVAGSWPVVARGSPLPHFDVHCPLLSLPRAFRTTLETIPRNLPYLQADANEFDKWRSRFAYHSLKVGLAWAGSPTHTNDRNRSLPLARFARLAQVPGVRFYSLQKSHSPAQAANASPGMELIDWTQELNDFADTAALVANLDLVISVDTAVAHLAGAMGKPVWTLLPFRADWRWLQKREDSPWYPTMRLFRQPSIGDWDSVMQQATESLAHVAQSRQIY